MEKCPADQMPQLKLGVSTILKKHNQGPCREYDILLYILAQPDSETTELTRYLRQLRDCVSVVSKEHEQLVGIILNMNWLERDPALTNEYKPLLLNLVSAHPYYLRACVRMLIKKFFPHDISKHKRDGAGDSKGPPDRTTRKKDEAKFGHVHELLKAVAKIVPTTRTVAIQLMKETFPYHTRDVYTHETFTRNLLTVVHYMPDLRQEILELIVEKMLHLDVRAPRKDIVEAEDSSDEDNDDEEEDPTVFQMDGLEEEEEENDEVDGEGKSSTEEEMVSQTMNHEEAMRLDIMMDLTLDHIHKTCYQDGELNWEVTKQLYRELLSVFNKLILPTYASCHPQFLLFYICSFRKELLVGFLDFLWKKVTSPMNQTVFRQAASGYVGSFLARATYTHISTVKATVKMMADWLHEYLNQAGSDVLHADLAHHAPFYAVSQAVFYVFCFRNQQLLDGEKGYKWAESLNFQRLVSSKLNPLKICLPLVCTTFASITRMHQLALCDTIIQRNDRLRFTSSEPTLEAYFPFDPYVLKRSSRWMKSLYREYEGVLPEIKNDVEDDEDEDDFIADEDSMGVSLGSSAPGAGASKLDFMQYTISPGFKL
ncbi:RNA polymerase I-specific transcription initiation factor RRN3-like [Littorina saxatilis]|uniref:RNA polymerase I-specific transcription initiation factor RRN3 n=1 Tax=Littorina saxatilis TaxID=31220 RepID=A0AAN9BUI2_9CAEN